MQLHHILETDRNLYRDFVGRRKRISITIKKTNLYSLTRLLHRLRLRRLQRRRHPHPHPPPNDRAQMHAAAVFALIMIKRCFYKQEHVDHDGASDDSDSSSSDSDSPPHKEDSDDDGVEEGEEDSKGVPISPPSRSGYESEDSSGNEVGCDSSGLPLNEEDGSEEGRVQSKDDHLIGEETSKATTPKDLIPDPDNSILKFKSVFKCRLCPRIVCLSESTIRAHLSSKRHARSKKLLGEGRLKLILNSDGEIEEEQETHAERHARTIALAQTCQEKDAPKKKDKGRKRQRKRRTKKAHRASDDGGAEKSSKRDKKKRRKVED